MQNKNTIEFLQNLRRLSTEKENKFIKALKDKSFSTVNNSDQDTIDLLLDFLDSIVLSLFMEYKTLPTKLQECKSAAKDFALERSEENRIAFAKPYNEYITLHHIYHEVSFKHRGVFGDKVFKRAEYINDVLAEYEKCSSIKPIDDRLLQIFNIVKLHIAFFDFDNMNPIIKQRFITQVQKTSHIITKMLLMASPQIQSSIYTAYAKSIRKIPIEFNLKSQAGKSAVEFVKICSEIIDDSYDTSFRSKKILDLIEFCSYAKIASKKPLLYMFILAPWMVSKIEEFYNNSNLFKNASQQNNVRLSLDKVLISTWLDENDKVNLIQAIVQRVAFKDKDVIKLMEKFCPEFIKSVIEPELSNKYKYDSHVQQLMDGDSGSISTDTLNRS